MIFPDFPVFIISTFASKGIIFLSFINLLSSIKSDFIRYVLLIKRPQNLLICEVFLENKKLHQSLGKL